jgi:heme-degrading monooxygenase HmoA
MILRSWHGIVPKEKAESFKNYLLNTGVAEIKVTPGNLGVYIHNQSQNNFEHFFMVSYWDNMESIRKFAGKNPHVAVCYAEDNKYELISDPIALHHEIKVIPSNFPITWVN